jgi:Leucine-rich repeat (LRR) protein
MNRGINVLVSFSVVAGVTACCCPCGMNRMPNFRGPRIVVPPPAIEVQPPPAIDFQPPPIPGDGLPKDGFAPKDLIRKDGAPPPVVDPNEAFIKNRKGSLKRDEGQPGRPIVEVNLRFTNTGDADLKGLATLVKLRKLDLSQNGGLTGAGFRDLKALQDLEELDVNFCPISDDGMKSIAGLRKLKKLSISGAKITDAGMREIAKLDNLQELSASGMLLNGPDRNEPRDAAIKELGRLSQLRKLDLSNTQTADESAGAFAGLPQLKVLHVFGTRITDNGLTELARLKKLEELKIGYSISDVGVSALAGNTSLQVLSVWNSSRVTDKSVPSLSTLKSLRELDIGSTGISIKGRGELAKALPRCKIKKK